MSSAIPSSSAQATSAQATPAKPQSSPEERLRRTASQLEGVFVQRLFAAMRETIPEGGIIDRSGAEDTFTSLLDQKLSDEVPKQWSGQHSIAETLYQQLRQRLPHAAAKTP